MTKLIGTSFKNSDTCKGMVFTNDAPLDLAEIKISGRYPEVGWARNRKSHEMVRMLRGGGRLILQTGEITELSEGDVVHVPPGDWFAWEGTMTILMTCSPAFDPEQYEVKEEL